MSAILKRNNRAIRLASGALARKVAGAVCHCCGGAVCERCAATETDPALVCPPVTSISLTLSIDKLRTIAEQLDAGFGEVGDGTEALIRFGATSYSGTVCCYELGLTEGTYGCKGVYVSAVPLFSYWPQVDYVDGEYVDGEEQHAYAFVSYDCTTGKISVSVPVYGTSSQGHVFMSEFNDTIANVSYDTRVAWPRACTMTGFTGDNAIPTLNSDVRVHDDTEQIYGGAGEFEIGAGCDPPFCGTCDDTSVLIAFDRPAGTYSSGDPGLSASFTVPRVMTDGVCGGYVLQTTYGGKAVTVSALFGTDALGNRWSAGFAYDNLADVPTGAPQSWGGSKRCEPLSPGGTGPLGDYEPTTEAGTVGVS